MLPKPTIPTVFPLSSQMFPVLLKFIDTREKLSVQVHPSDDYALEHEKQYGKTEMWYILNAEKGAGIYYGLKSDITKEEFERHIKENTLTDALNFIEVKKGESYFIPAGTIHAIGKGLLIAEIQQNSNATYRIFDYGRTDNVNWEQTFKEASESCDANRQYDSGYEF